MTTPLHSNSLYNPKLQKNSHELRSTMTKAEACLWKYVLKAKMTGYTFNRQRPVLNYIADFMCKELNLIIEVDGYSHTVDSVITKDAKKQSDLEKEGFKVLRFTDDEVLKGIENVRRSVEDTIEKITGPPPTPSRGGQTTPFEIKNKQP